MSPPHGNLKVDKEKLKEEWIKGTPIRIIADQFGVTDATVCYHARQLGLDPRQERASDSSPAVLRHGQWIRNDRGVMVWRKDG